MSDKPTPGAKAEIVTAAVAMGSIGSLVGLTVSGILSMLPVWAAVAVVVVELSLPLVIYQFLRRAEERR